MNINVSIPVKVSVSVTHYPYPGEPDKVGYKASAWLMNREIAFSDRGRMFWSEKSAVASVRKALREWQQWQKDHVK